MANKKISQLNAVDSSVGIGTESVFPMVSGTSSSNYQTTKVTSLDIAKFVLNPMPVGGGTDLSSIGFTGSSNIKFKKTNWENASTDVAVNPYLQVRLDDGQLITGSGVAVPAALGDDMGNCTATTDLDLANYDVINTDDIYFGGGDTVSTRIEYEAPGVKDLKVQAERDLTLSGIRHVKISGQALDLVNTPISGNVTITGGNLEIDPANKLIVNEIGLSRGEIPSDRATLSIDGASLHIPYDTNDWTNESVSPPDIYWSESNIQFATVHGPNESGYIFNTAYPGQTMTMYVENVSSTTPYTPTFSTPAASGSNKVLWGGTGGPPHIEQSRTNIYTFACYDGVIFASAITGYEY